MEEGEEPERVEKAQRLKAQAEAKFDDSKLKSALKYAKRAHRLCPNLDGLSSMLTSFKILRSASNSADANPDWYGILQVEPFSHLNIIKKQYKKLAFLVHPDKNAHVGSEEAFKLVNEAFRFLSDKVRRQEYDMKLRIRIQDEKIKEGEELDKGGTFWTACSTCRLLHQFERRYLGHNLVCPSCRKSFKATEVEVHDVDDGVKVRNERLRSRNMSNGGNFGDLGMKRKMGSVRMGRQRAKSWVDGGVLEREVGGEWSGGRLRKRTSSVGEVMERTKPNQGKVASEDMMTLAEMQSQLRKKVQQEKTKLKFKEKDKDKVETKIKHKEIESRVDSERNGDLEAERLQVTKKSKELIRGKCGNSEEEKKSLKLKEKENVETEIKQKEKENSVESERNRDLEAETQQMTKKSKEFILSKCGNYEQHENFTVEKNRSSKSKDLEIMPVEDSDFYDFDKDRVERSFKKGQVWAMYDDDGMPRHYGFIDEVISVNPFEVKMSWLDLQHNENEGLISWEEMGFNVSCGRFKVSRKAIVDSLNIFSHVVDSERAAREIYRIYPKKGSVWALYNNEASAAEETNDSVRNKLSYDIVVVLTTFTEMNGLSMAYLEKVGDYNTLFKRSEIGSHAISLLETDDIKLFSHQIPARKLSASEVPELVKDCWELDPASLPSDLLKVRRKRR